MTMFGRPDEPINDALHLTPFAPSVFVAFPSFDDWIGLYQTQSHGAQWNRDMYADFRRNHERTVSEQLQTLTRSAVGRAIFAELNARTEFSVMILPFDFLEASSWSLHVGAVTSATDRRAEWKKGVPICGATMDGKPFCYASHGHGGGSDVQIFFTARRHRGREPADEVLLHELMHATRKVRGVLYRMPMHGSYGNQEEFLAVLAANMYRSEKRKEPFDYHGGAINPATFLDDTASRAVLAGLRADQPAFFAALARVEVAFNPIRQVDVEYRALMQKIERN